MLHYPKCLYFVSALKIVLHSSIEIVLGEVVIALEVHLAVVELKNETGVSSTIFMDIKIRHNIALYKGKGQKTLMEKKEITTKRVQNKCDVRIISVYRNEERIEGKKENVNLLAFFFLAYLFSLALS